MRKSGKLGFALSAPYLIYALMFVIFPLLFSVFLIFHRWDGMSAPTWIGLKNLVRLVNDSLFYRSLLNTLQFLLIHIPLQIFFALLFAVALNSVKLLRGFFRAVYFMPVVVSGVVVTIVWLQLYSYDNGILNGILTSIHLPRVPWLTSTTFAMPSIAVMATWKNVGLYTIMFLAGLQGIPDEFYEAATMDGASQYRKFVSITIPLLAPTMTLVVVLSTINGFSLFVEPFVMTGGGPLNATLSSVLYVYNQAFSFGHLGYAAALGFVFALVILLSILIQRKFLGAE
ncbi:MAG TPA: sugar ABC transporter permease [Candidatus Kryptonia bacterium]